MNSQHFCINNGTTKIGLVFVFLVAFLSFDSSVYAQKKEFVVMLDAGHGGHDPGTRGDISKEKDLALKIALKLGDYIEDKLDGVEVIYTRDNDTFVELHGTLENML